MTQITGKIKKIMDAQQVSDKFKKREFVVTTTDTQYPQDILMQLTQDRCNAIDGFRVGNEVKVSINIRGREWTSPKGEIKYFNTLEAWRIEGEQSQHYTTETQTHETTNEPTQETPASTTFTDDDLPF